MQSRISRILLLMHIRDNEKSEVTEIRCYMITYSKAEEIIIEEGIEELSCYLFGDDITQIRRLLLCLDWYLDPYYQKHLSYEKDVWDLLQKLVVTSQNTNVVDDCLQLIRDYCTISLDILEAEFNNIINEKNKT